jgi:ABC-type uncharacterized transport system permease subunit
MILSSAPAGPVAAWPWLPAAAAVLAYGLAAVPGEAWRRAATVAFVAGWLLQAMALVVDIGGVGRAVSGVHFGFAPALSMILWLVLAVHAIERRFVPLPGVRRTLALAGASVVLLAAVFPGEMKVSEATPWVSVHWLLGVASYGLFGAAVLHALLLDAAERQLRLKQVKPGVQGPLGLPLLRLERLTFRFVEAGFVVLSVALLFGLWSTTQWHWDHKTVFSLLGWATFALLLSGRKAYGWRGRRATRWLYIGSALLLLAYIGSRFVLEVLLNRTTG